MTCVGGGAVVAGVIVWAPASVWGRVLGWGPVRGLGGPRSRGARVPVPGGGGARCAAGVPGSPVWGSGGPR